MNYFINLSIIFKIFIISFVFLYIPALTYGNISSDLKNLVGKNAKESKNLIIYDDYHIVYSYFPEKKEYWWKKKDKKCVSVIINDGKIEKFLQISNKKCESAAALLRKNGLDYHIGSAPVRNKVLDSERAKLENDGLKPSYWVKSQFLDRSIEYWLGNDGETCKHIIFITIDGNFISVNKDEFSQCLFFERANKM